MRREIEVTVRIGNEPAEMGALGIIAWHLDIEVLSSHLYRDRDGAVLLLVTTNPQKAVDVLRSAGFQCKTNPIVLVGPLRNIGLAALIGAELAVLGIEILSSYVSRVGADHQYLVLKTTDDERAMQMLEMNSSICGETRSKSWSEQNLVSQAGPNWQQAAA
jgi:hypothetical protein